MSNQECDKKFQIHVSCLFCCFCLLNIANQFIYFYFWGIRFSICTPFKLWSKHFQHNRKHRMEKAGSINRTYKTLTFVNVIGIAGSNGNCSGTSENCCCCFCIVSNKVFTSCLANRILAASWNNQIFHFKLYFSKVI